MLKDEVLKISSQRKIHRVGSTHVGVDIWQTQFSNRVAANSITSPKIFTGPFCSPQKMSNMYAKVLRGVNVLCSKSRTNVDDHVYTIADTQRL